MLKVKVFAAAELMTTQLHPEQLMFTVESSSVSDTNDPGEFTDFANRNEDRVSKVAASDTSFSETALARALLAKLKHSLGWALFFAGLLLVAWTLDLLFVANA